MQNAYTHSTKTNSWGNLTSKNSVLTACRYSELSNHLGSVLNVVTDRKLPIDSDNNGIVDYYTADVVSYADYYPGGSLLPGRHGSADQMRYGYQGSEMDNEVKGVGNQYTTQFRQLDTRLVRWWSIDPKPEAGMSPYSSMDNNPIRYNDVLGQYTEKRAERMKNKAEKQGYSVSDVKHNEGGGRKDYYFNISKRNDENTGTYSRTMSHGKFSGMKEQHLTLDSEYKLSFFDLGLATSSALIDKGKDFSKTITNSRSGFSSGSLGDGSGKIYNKANAKVANKVLTGLGYTLNAVSVISSEIDYSQGEITEGRRDFNRLNAGTSLAFPVAGIPIAAGDYLGQKYHPQIEHQVTKGVLNQVVVGVLDFMGYQTTPYPRGSSEEKEYLQNYYK